MVGHIATGSSWVVGKIDGWLLKSKWKNFVLLIYQLPRICRRVFNVPHEPKGKKGKFGAHRTSRVWYSVWCERPRGTNHRNSKGIIWAEMIFSVGFPPAFLFFKITQDMKDHWPYYFVYTNNYDIIPVPKTVLIVGLALLYFIVSKLGVCRSFPF